MGALGDDARVGKQALDAEGGLGVGLVGLGAIALGRLESYENHRIAEDHRAIDRALTVEAWCERIEGRKVHLAGELRDGATTVAQAHALFVEVDLSHFERGGRELPDRWRDWPAGETPVAP